MKYMYFILILGLISCANKKLQDPIPSNKDLSSSKREYLNEGDARIKNNSRKVNIRKIVIKNEIGSTDTWYLTSHAPYHQAVLSGGSNTPKGLKYINDSLKYVYPLLKKHAYTFKTPQESVKILEQLGYKLLSKGWKKISLSSQPRLRLFDRKIGSQISGTRNIKAYCFKHIINRNSGFCFVNKHSLLNAGLSVKAR